MTKQINHFYPSPRHTLILTKLMLAMTLCFSVQSYACVTPTSDNKNADCTQPSDTKTNKKTKAKTQTQNKNDTPFFARQKKGKWGFVDMNGTPMIVYAFDEVRPYSENLAGVRMGENWGFINKAGEVVIDFRFPQQNTKDTTNFFVFINHQAWVGYKNDGTTLCINQTGETIDCLLDEKAMRQHLMSSEYLGRAILHKDSPAKHQPLLAQTKAITLDKPLPTDAITASRPAEPPTPPTAMPSVIAASDNTNHQTPKATTPTANTPSMNTTENTTNADTQKVVTTASEPSPQLDKTDEPTLVADIVADDTAPQNPTTNPTSESPILASIDTPNALSDVQIIDDEEDSGLADGSVLTPTTTSLSSLFFFGTSANSYVDSDDDIDLAEHTIAPSITHSMNN